MNTEGDQDAIRTPQAVIVMAWVVGILGGFGVAAPHSLGCGPQGPEAMLELALGFLLGLGAGAGFVGVIALLAGAKLGRNFSYPFTAVMVFFFLVFVTRLLSFYDRNMSSGWFPIMWFAGPLLGIGGSVFLARHIGGYGRQVRPFVAVGAIAMLLIGALITRFRHFLADDTVALLGGLCFAVVGGSLSAVVGAIKVRLSRRASPKNRIADSG